MMVIDYKIKVLSSLGLNPKSLRRRVRLEKLQARNIKHIDYCLNEKQNGSHTLKIWSLDEREFSHGFEV